MYILRRDDKALSYSRMRELFIQAFQSFVPDITKFGLHSLPSGDATTCANLGISDRFLKSTGGGVLKQLRMAMLRTRCLIGSLFPKIWGYRVLNL